MNTFLLSLASIAACTVTAFSEGERGKWLVSDKTDPSQTRHANVWLAARITVEGDRVTLFTIKDGKFVPYFESNDPDAAKNMRAQISYDNLSSIQMDDGSVVSAEFVTSCSFSTESGREVATLTAYGMDLGTVSAEKQVEKVKYHFGLARARPVRKVR